MLSRNRCIIALALLLHCAALAAETPPAKKPVREIIPRTAENFQDEASVWREGVHAGLLVVPSGEKAWAYFKGHAGTSAGQARDQMWSDVSAHTGEYGKRVGGVAQSGLDAGKQVFKAGTAVTGGIGAVTHNVAQPAVDYGSEAWKQASQRFILGYMTYTERTDEDRKALRAIPGDYFVHLKDDFSNLRELEANADITIATHIKGDWSRAWDEGVAAWNEAYERSGERSSPWAGLMDVLAGNAKQAYYAVAKPAARSTLQGADATLQVAGQVGEKVATNMVFLPTAAAFIVSGEFVRSSGLALYYSSSAGIKLVTPYLEGGVLTGLSLLSYGAAGATYGAGGAVGAVNQIAVTVVATPVAAAGTAAMAGAGHTAVYGARVTYDLLKGSTRVALNETSAGIVLGYAALTQVPWQVLQATANAGYFLVFDAKGLAIATYRGEVQWHDDSGAKASVSARDLPVGSVLNLDALGKENGANIEVITRDPKIIQEVLKKMPQDMGAGEQP